MLNEILYPISLKIPTQTWRSREQNSWQQFSTPPSIAYLLTYLLNLEKGESVLEPSAGNWELVVWTSGNELKTYTNEIDPRQRILLKQIGFTPTGFDAEFINDFLKTEISPNCILMNPPFFCQWGKNQKQFG